MPLTLDNFDFPLDERLIAQHPLDRRDRSRLMVLRRPAGGVEHRRFDDLPQLLQPGDLLVLNDTRVIPARFFCRRASGGKIEGLFLQEPAPGRWEAMLKNAGGRRAGEVLTLVGADVRVRLAENLGGGRWALDVTPALPAAHILEQAGTTPLPPYIRRSGMGVPPVCPAGVSPAMGGQDGRRGDPEAHATSQSTAEDRERYQTVYARAPGAVAAPTAGLHFTPEVLGALAGRGITTATVTLHVGPGTFLPVKVDDIAQHKMHAEWYELPAATAAALNAARAAGRRIVAVGTTSVRVLETAAGSAAPMECGGEIPKGCRRRFGSDVDSCQGELKTSGRSESVRSDPNRGGPIQSGDYAAAPLRPRTPKEARPTALFAPASGWTDIFIYPPRQFAAVDALITNFHLPKSTLLMLVAAFCDPGGMRGIPMILDAYAAACREGYRFFSYGDAMLIE